MPHKLKTFTTSIGFYDLAVAAPSMKAALQAWGVRRNLFHEGTAQETDHADVVDATLAQPGVVLRRAVGSKEKFTVDALPPKSLPSGGKMRAPVTKAKPKRKALANARFHPVETTADDKAKVIQFEAEKVRREKARETERPKQEAAGRRDQDRREKAIAKGEAELDRARKKHQTKLRKLEKALAIAQGRVDAEITRWKAEAEKLESGIETAGR